MLAVGYPLRWVMSGDAQSGSFYSRQKTGPKHLGQGEFIEQVFALFLFPLVPCLIHPATRYDDMQMRVIVQTAGVSEQKWGQIYFPLGLPRPGGDQG
jgi:hypothetical protein